MPSSTPDNRLSVSLSPHGHLALVPDAEGAELDAKLALRLRRAFEKGSGYALLQLGGGEAGRFLPAVFSYWQELGLRYVTAVCAVPGIDQRGTAFEIPPPAHDELDRMAATAPAMTGAEYLTAAVLKSLWAQLDAAFRSELAESGQSIQDFLRQLNPGWNLVGRVHFNLAENRLDQEAPFAFLATYTAQLTAARAGGSARPQHLPLGQALREYAGAANKQRLLSLLLPVQRAAEQCAWLRNMIDAGEIFYPLRWTPTEALQLLHDVPLLEQAGVIVRMPAGWKAGRPARPRVTAKVGDHAPSGLGQEALLDFQIEVTLDGQVLTAAEIRQLLAGSEGLAFVRGQWVEIDRERLARMLEHFRAIEQRAAAEGISFGAAVRMLAGAHVSADGAERIDREWSAVVAGPWLAETLKALRSPEGMAHVEHGTALKGTLRPYQEVGVRWLHLLTRMGLGACLADDMGLGKTIQVLAVLLVQRRGANKKRPNLLIAPASLLANWAAEIDRFAPELRTLIAHPSELPAGRLRSLTPEILADVDLVITSYGSLLRIPWLVSHAWGTVILDEAQAIKNPEAKQTREVKKIAARARVALTGTPIENRLGDLWSIFDFINPGLLGSAREFNAYTKQLAKQTHNAYGPLRDLVRPYILRRLKTDPAVISDLPEKTEVKAWCQLSRRQAALYQESVKELAERLKITDEGIHRKGLVLAFLMRFKQICNHPSQWLGDGAWGERDSGKWARLREIAEVIAARQEKVLVFTQFREVTSPLAAFLAEVFGRPGLVLHGQTQVRQRKDLVDRFQQDETVPFFVLSLKAGGFGLNLTAASHVVHFDRWWNPAVENQATDRAFRIGQVRNVLVHKFVCRGTVEEKIDALIESKKHLAKELLEGGAELNLTEMSDEELMRLVALDLHAALKE